MLQFTSQEITRIREKVTNELIEKLIADNFDVLNSETLVPPDARATWNLYYFCPEHGVRLNWDRKLDLTKVHNPEKRRLDMTYIVRGSHCHDESFIPTINPFSKVLARLENCFQNSFDEQALRYQIEGEREFNQQIFVNQKSLMYLCSGLDNPATSKVAYTVVRSQSERFSSVVLHDLDGGAMVKSVSWINDALVEIELCRNGVNSRYQYNYSTSKLAFV